MFTNQTELTELHRKRKKRHSPKTLIYVSNTDIQNTNFQAVIFTLFISLESINKILNNLNFFIWYFP